MQYFVSDCVGIELVGVVTALRSLSLVLASILSGKIIMYSSRTGLSIITMMFTMTLLYYMLFWERKPSYIAVFLLAVGLGAGNGSLTSTAAGKHILYCIPVMCVCVRACVRACVSWYMFQ